MSHTHRAQDATSTPASLPALSTGLTLLLAFAAGLPVATLYYAQPLLGVLANELGASAQAVGLVPTATQLGYALGILFFAPLGDRLDRRRIILVKAAALTVALLAAATASSIAHLIGASLAMGMTASMAQDVVPAAATLAPAAQRGRTVGVVMTGLLLGILVSRTLSGVIAEQLGWRAVFVTAAISIALVGAALYRALPRFEPTTQASYRALLGSLGSLVTKHPALRRAALAQGLLATGFSAFWSTLAVMLHASPFHLGSAAAGAFGLAGAAGALIAPLAGRVADKRGPAVVTRVGTALAALSFAAMAAGPALSPSGQLWLLAIATVGFDLGVQATLIAHQSIVYGLEPEARSRLNAVLFVSMFVAMAVGAAVGSVLLARWGFQAVVGYAFVTAFAAFGVRMAGAKRAGLGTAASGV